MKLLKSMRLRLEKARANAHALNRNPIIADLPAFEAATTLSETLTTSALSLVADLKVLRNLSLQLAKSVAAQSETVQAQIQAGESSAAEDPPAENNPDPLILARRLADMNLATHPRMHANLTFLVDSRQWLIAYALSLETITDLLATHEAPTIADALLQRLTAVADTLEEQRAVWDQEAVVIAQLEGLAEAAANIAQPLAADRITPFDTYLQVLTLWTEISSTFQQHLQELATQTQRHLEATRAVEQSLGIPND
ncbi:hypothetical protein [Acanthopleuribacter pedis]|uniref:Uncharacterized protein n=1 Tax=Acanthopleuribacter pedis TaxID=442870 RepID=A0A8J7Q613_9BACT|nr:hypothetical protein [Acanthopleuribacter pedis]MBO1318792.1 hypothetical protein [Acanthopleuribacter pedis]